MKQAVEVAILSDVAAQSLEISVPKQAVQKKQQHLRQCVKEWHRAKLVKNFHRKLKRQKLAKTLSKPRVVKTKKPRVVEEVQERGCCGARILYY